VMPLLIRAVDDLTPTWTSTDALHVSLSPFCSWSTLVAYLYICFGLISMSSVWTCMSPPPSGMPPSRALSGNIEVVFLRMCHHAASVLVLTPC
jgi:hypothetical protein